jgi:hypothetical protein
LELGAEASDVVEAEASDVVEDYFEEMQQQQQQASAEVTITNTGQRTGIHRRVFLVAKERNSAPDVTWACAWCLVSRGKTQK